jgi:hypothetical protein
MQSSSAILRSTSKLISHVSQRPTAAVGEDYDDPDGDFDDEELSDESVGIDCDGNDGEQAWGSHGVRVCGSPFWPIDIPQAHQAHAAAIRQLCSACNVYTMCKDYPQTR